MSTFDITVQDYKEMRERGVDHVLLDIRGRDEREICHLDDDLHISMSEISMRYQELDPQKLIVVYCHHGIRSNQVAQFLDSEGFKSVKNLRGGVEAWAQEIDPNMPRY